MLELIVVEHLNVSKLCCRFREQDFHSDCSSYCSISQHSPFQTGENEKKNISTIQQTTDAKEHWETSEWSWNRYEERWMKKWPKEQIKWNKLYLFLTLNCIFTKQYILCCFRLYVFLFFLAVFTKRLKLLFEIEPRNFLTKYACDCASIML